MRTFIIIKYKVMSMIEYKLSIKVFVWYNNRV